MTEELAKDVSGAGDPGDKVEALVAAEEKTRKEQQQQQLPRVTQNKDGLANFNLINPFVHTLVVGNLVDFAQILVGSLILFPLRVLGIIVFLLLTWVAALIGLYGMSKEDIAKKPLTGWRKECRNVARTLLRGVFFFGSFHRIKCIGKQAPARKAPIVVVAPHSSFFDSLVALVTGPPSVVAKAETADLPFFGKLIDFTQPIYVCREDPNSRQNTIQAIKERASSTEDWPPLLIFPEGTCTNRSALISFKLGAFYPGVPIQPVIVRYPNRRDSFTWTWCGPGPMHLLWLTLTKAFSNVEVEYLPVYVPSEEEKQNPKLYAQNVRQVMSKALDMPISDYTYTDCKTLARAKDINLKRFLSAVEVDKMRQALGLNRTNIEEQIVATSASDANLRLNFDEFCRRLKIVENDFARRLFDVFAVPQVLEKEEEEVDGPGDEKKKEKFVEFREYLLFALFLIKFKQPNIQLLELAFKLHGGAVTRQTFTTTICQLLGRKRIDSAEAADALFNEIRKAAEDKVTFDEFSACVEQKPKFSCLFSPPKDYAP